MVAQEQRQFDDAIVFYQKAIQIYEDAGDFYSAATEYALLGIVAQDQGDFETAVTYFQIAFEALTTANDWCKASSTLTAWGKTLEARANWTEATKIYIRALVIEVEHNKQWIDWYLQNLGRMLEQLGDSQFKIIWREFTGDECPEHWFSAIQEASSSDSN
jgi:tetratricopeptide (TPR) repeat protein